MRPGDLVAMYNYGRIEEEVLTGIVGYGAEPERRHGAIHIIQEDGREEYWEDTYLYPIIEGPQP